MMIFHKPPTRRSTSQTGILEPSQPHQCRICSGRVQASNRACRGRWNRHEKRISVSEGRVTVTSWFSFTSTFPDLLYIKCGKVVVEPIHPVFPKPAIALHPIGNLNERCSLQPAGAPLRIAATGDKARTFENFEMFGDRWCSNREG